MDGEILYSTITLLRDGKETLLRLPMDLIPWALESVNKSVEMGKSLFPCGVEFCNINDSHSADFSLNILNIDLWKKSLTVQIYFIHSIV